MTVRVTRRLWGVIVAAAVVYFFATNSGVVWLYLLTALVLAMIPVGLVAPFLAVSRVRVEPRAIRALGFRPPLRQDQGKVFAGDHLVIHLRASGNLVACRLGPLLLLDGRTLPVADSADERAPSVAVENVRRGRIQVEGIRITSSWPLGILTVLRWLPLHVPVVVHPRYVVPPADSHAGNRETSGDTGLRGPGEEFLGLREYRSGDSQRRVHWPTTARSGTLMVIQTAMESRSPARYGLAVGPDATAGGLDIAATAAASLAAGNVAGGRPFHLHLPGRRAEVQGWAEALAELALLEAHGESAPPDDPTTTMVLAGHDAAHLHSARGDVTIPANADMDAVLRALDEA
ncbi:MAG: hypothetical protein QOE92_74 [Chloroflexota bacterium]|nr:hypothetical protein [Chloroflexota bacterium]